MRKARLGEVKVSQGSQEDDSVRQGRDFPPRSQELRAQLPALCFQAEVRMEGRELQGPDLPSLLPQKLHAAKCGLGPLFRVEMK